MAYCFIAGIASLTVIPFKKPELTMMPVSSLSVKASFDMRGMIAALHLMTDGMAPKDAIAVSITNKCFDEYEYALVRDVALTRFA